MYMNIKDFFQKKTRAEAIPAQPISNLYKEPSVKPAPAKYTLADRGVEITDSDIEAMRPLVYGEVSNRPFDKKSLEADVIFNTGLNRMKEYARKKQPRTLSEVVAMPNQYQAYGGDQYKNYFNPQDEPSIAKKREVDMIVDAIRDKIRKGEYVDNTEGAFYYIHERDGKIKYDNLKKLFAE